MDLCKLVNVANSLVVSLSDSPSVLVSSSDGILCLCLLNTCLVSIQANMLFDKQVLLPVLLVADLTEGPAPTSGW